MSPLIDLIGSAKGYGWGALVAGGSFESIATITAASDSTNTNFNFTSIPSIYTHLQLRIIHRNTATGVTGNYIRFNGSGSNVYAYHRLSGNGTSATAGAFVPDSSIQFDGKSEPNSNDTSNIFAATIIDILDYTNTNKFKTTRTLNGFDINGSGRIAFLSGLWRDTTAINRVEFGSLANYFTAGSTAALYGIKG
jgi:hypothetical protein